MFLLFGFGLAVFRDDGVGLVRRVLAVWEVEFEMLFMT